MPRTTTGIIPRQELMNILDSLADERLIYICAPAGYGKTVAIRQLLERRSCKNALLSLDAYDNNPSTLCLRFCSALKACQPGNKLLNEITTHSAFSTAADEFSFHAIASLDHSKEALLVIDDLHFITNEVTLKLISSFLKKLPRSFKVVITSRYRLPKSFLDLWIKNNIAYIPEEHLCFKVGEILSLYEKQGLKITLKQAEEILQFTGGWAIGINAMLLSGEHSGSLTGRLEYLDKFIAENLSNRWTKDTYDFMAASSVVTEMTPELCKAITGRKDSGSILNSLFLENAFISRSDDGIYTYHNLFHKFLYGKLNEGGKKRRDSLLQKAGEWYLENKDFYKALDCFMRAENHKSIARCFGLMVTQGHEYFLADKLIQVANSSMLQAVARIYPSVYSVLAWGAFNEGLADDMAYYADRYYENQDKIVALDSRQALNIMMVQLIDYRKTLFELARYAEEGDFDPGTRDLSAIGVKIGIINQNMPLLHRGTRDFSECACGNLEKNVELMKKSFGGLFGEQTEILVECVLAGISYEHGLLERAYSYAVSAVAGIKTGFSPETKLCALSILINILDALEQGDKAEQFIENMENIIENDRAYYLNSNFSALKTRRELARGDMRAAKSWLAGHKPPISLPNRSLDFYNLYTHMTTVRACITNGSYDFAIVSLKNILKLAETYKRPLDIIESNTLLAIACWMKRRGFQKEAMKYIEAAVTEAHNYSFVQVFVNEGSEIKAMLNRLQKKVEQPAYGSLIPASFVRYISGMISEHSETGLTSGQAAKAVKFTEKQKKVISLLCQGKSYSEIAQEMGVTNSTARSHISGIYNKLSVTTKEDAVKAVKKLGIF